MSDFQEGMLHAVGVLAFVCVVALTVMGFVKLGSAWFNLAPGLNGTSLQECAAAHGTPVLEADGQAYKSCAINGKSVTSNIVK